MRSDTESAGALAGMTVVEIASENSAYTAKLLSDMGADVVVVEPPGGAGTRSYAPFAGGTSDPELSLWWWHYNTGKRSVVVDRSTAEGVQTLRALIERADVVVEGERPGALAADGLDYADLAAGNERLIWVSITPYGRDGLRSDECASDLTLLAEGGAVWSNGYDDHTIPPVRGGGYQSLHVSGVFAAMSALTAVLYRDAGGAGQLVDVNMYAAVNVTTESSSFEWLARKKTVQRQTGRHALTFKTMNVQVQAGDGRWVTTGFAPQSQADFEMLLAWLDEIGARDEFEKTPFLEMGVERGGANPHVTEDDPLNSEIFGSGREALVFVAGRMGAYEFFTGAQQRNFQCGIIYSPDEALRDPHFVDRGFPVQVTHDEWIQPVTYPGAPFRMTGSPINIAPAPRIGQHSAEILADLAASLSAID